MRISAKKNIPIEVLKIDLLQDMEKFPVTDVIVDNDVLEHFNDEISLNILKGLWKRTGKLLIVHVLI